MNHVFDGRKIFQRNAGGRSPTQRMLRVGEEMRHALATLLRQYQPFQGEAREVSVTVTEVKMSPDLRCATVFVMPFASGEETKNILTSLRKDSGALLHKLAGRLSLKFLPMLRFNLDESLERANRIETLLRESR